MGLTTGAEKWARKGWWFSFNGVKGAIPPLKLDAVETDPMASYGCIATTGGSKSALIDEY
jgi:hypothetical protein